MVLGSVGGVWISLRLDCSFVNPPGLRVIVV